MVKFSFTVLLASFCLIGAACALDIGRSTEVLLHSNGYSELLKHRLQNVREYEGCVLPPFPDNGKYVIDGSSSPPVPGDIVPDLTILFFSCNKGAIMDGNYITVCNDGKWTKEAPTCAVDTNCILPQKPADGQFEVVGATTQPKPGDLVGEFTIIKFKCNILFDLDGDGTSICRSGNWTTSSPACQRSNRCLIPNPPVKGTYSIFGSSVVPVAGTDILEHEILKYDCPAPNYLLSDSISICSKGQWVVDIPECVNYESCADVKSTKSGIYHIRLPGTCDPVPIYCDMTLLGGKWTLIQQRVTDSVAFNKRYADYVEGFGSPEENLWIGLDRIHEFTKDGDYELYVELYAFTGEKAIARYDTFKVGNVTEGYALTLTGFNGTAGDSMHGNDGMKFSTYDKDQDASSSNCAQKFAAGWWFKDCTQSNLNGQYYNSANIIGDGTIHWFTFKKQAALMKTRMLIRKK